MGYAMMRGTWKVTLAQISAITGVLLSTCSNIIREAKRRPGAAKPGGNLDLCALENLVPRTNNEKGSRSLLSENEKQHLVAVRARLPIDGRLATRGSADRQRKSVM